MHSKQLDELIEKLGKLIDTNNIEDFTQEMKTIKYIDNPGMIRFIDNFAEKPNIDNFFSILINNLAITPDTLFNGMQTIIRKNKINLLDILLKHENISTYILSNMAIASIYEKNVDFLNTLIQHKNTTPRLLVKLISHLIHKDDNIDIHQKHMDFFYILIKNENIKDANIDLLLKSILNKPKTINNNNIEMLLFLSLMSKDTTFFKKFLTSGYATDNITNKVIDKVLYFKNKDAFKFLTQRLNIKEEYMCNIVQSCIFIKDDLDYLKYLIQNQNIHQDNISYLIDLFLITEKIEALKIVIENADISEKTITLSLRTAIIQKNQESFDVIVQHPNINLEDIYKEFNNYKQETNNQDKDLLNFINKLEDSFNKKLDNETILNIIRDFKIDCKKSNNIDAITSPNIQVDPVNNNHHHHNNNQRLKCCSIQ